MRELVPHDDAVTGLGEFYDLLWEQEPGYVYLPNRNPSKSKDDPEYWQKVMFEWPKDRSKIIQYTLAQNAKGCDVYAAPVIFTERRPIQENIKGSFTCWVDFDGNAPSEWPSYVPPTAQEGGLEALAVLEGTPTPTLRILSSRTGHEHVYWRFKELQTDIEFIANTNRALAYKHRADTSGWDPNQVLRPPYTTNYKHNIPVKIEASTEYAYTRESFAAFKKVKQLVSESIEIKDVPPVEKVIAKYKWDDHHFDLFMKKDVEEGKRSSALMALGFFGAETGMTDEEIYSLLINADDRWGKFKNRSDRQKRLTDIINRARHKYPVGANTAETQLRGLLSSEDNVEEAEELVYGFDAFNALDIKLEWIIEGLLERQGMGMVSSAPGVGKTQWTLQFGICCALGNDILDYKVLRRFKILWFSLEMHAPALQFFTKQMAQAYSPSELQVLDDNLKIVPMGEVLPLDHPEGRKFFEAMIEQYEPDGILIDSMGKVTNESLADEKKAKELNAYYSKIRKKYDLFIWFVHHNRKANDNNKKPKDLADIYGNQYLQADLSVALSLWRNEGEEDIELSEIKTRLGKVNKPKMLRRDENLHFRVVREVNPVAESPLLKEVKSEPDPGSTNGGRKPGSVPPTFGF